MDETGATYETTWLILPPGWFGLPDSDKTVVPAADGLQVAGGAMDSITGMKAGYGTLSRYRDEPLHIGATNALDFSVSLNDNYMRVCVHRATPDQAVRDSSVVAWRICGLLTVTYGHVFRCECQSVANLDTKQKVNEPKKYEFLNARLYNTEALRNNLIRAISVTDVMDSVLEKAIAYHSHAATIMGEDAARIHRFQRWLRASDTLLNYSKAIACIVGEPKKNRDFQKRYKSIGLSKADWDRAERIRQIRNDEDVAHYEPNWDQVMGLEKKIPEARATSSTVIHQYSDHLLAEGGEVSNEES